MRNKPDPHEDRCINVLCLLLSQQLGHEVVITSRPDLLAHLGRSITSLGDLDIPGFYGSELRQHARRLLDSGDARGEWLALVQSKPGVGPRVPTTVIAPEPDALCSLCDDYGPRVAYHQPGGQVLRLHPACQAIWLEERDRPR
jgi:hypothetical protein